LNSDQLDWGGKVNNHRRNKKNYLSAKQCQNVQTLRRFS
jgi:hypothetical protein